MEAPAVVIGDQPSDTSGLDISTILPRGRQGHKRRKMLARHSKRCIMRLSPDTLEESLLQRTSDPQRPLPPVVAATLERLSHSSR